MHLFKISAALDKAPVFAINAESKSGEDKTGAAAFNQGL